MVAQALAGAVTTPFTQRAPAGVGAEARPVALRQAVETCRAGIDAARARVGERAAAKRREAGAEDHAGVNQIRVLDDALAQARDVIR